MSLSRNHRVGDEWAAVYRRRPVRGAWRAKAANPDGYKDQTRLARVVELVLGVGLILAALLFAGRGLQARAAQYAPRAAKLTSESLLPSQLKLFDLPAGRQDRGTRRSKASRRRDQGRPVRSSDGRARR